MNAAVAPDVPDDDTPLTQGLPDEEPAVAPGGVFLAAKQGDPAGRYLPFQPMYTIEERLGAFDKRVVHPALRVVELFPIGPSAQLPAEEQVPDPIARQGRPELSDVEVRRVPGVRARASVHQDLDPVPLQQAGELLCRVVGVPDRKNRLPALRRTLIGDG